MSAKFRLTNTAPFAPIAEKAVLPPMLEITRDARFACPVDTGNLANSIQMSGPVKTGTYSAEGSVGTNVYYGPFVELGTRRMAARPFLGPALEKARRKWG